MFIYILLGLVLLTSWGQCQSLPPERPTDTKVVQFEPIPEAVDGNCTYNPGPKKFASFLFRINRVVGGANAIDSQGRLLNPEALIRDGIVSRFAEMKFRVSDLPYTVRPRIGSFGAAAVLEVNGQKVKDAILTRYNGTIEVAVKVPISYLKFGQRIPGLSPVPGVNLATVTMNTARLPQIGPEPSVECGAEIREFFFEPRYLRFDALAPIFLVHGNNECPAFFKDSGRCLPPNHQDRYRFNFESALQELAMPYTVGREMKPHTVAVHARQLVSIVGDQAREFGSKHFHIIAHSKGGLDSREYFLTINRAKAEPGPYSLVTLDTPHLGSPGSDYMEAGKDAWLGNQQRLWLSWLITRSYNPDQWAANRDLTTFRSFLRTQRHKNALPDAVRVDGVENRVMYFAFGADANLDASVGYSGFPIPSYGPTIDEYEARGLGFPAVPTIPVPPPNDPKYFSTAVYRMLGEVKSVGTFGGVAVEEPASGFQLNDIAVPLWSAYGMPEKFVSLNYVKKNHATISEPDIARIALGLVRQAQPMDEALMR